VGALPPPQHPPTLVQKDYLRRSRNVYEDIAHTVIKILIVMDVS
jgi:hypothetical protein